MMSSLKGGFKIRIIRSQIQTHARAGILMALDSLTNGGDELSKS